MLLSRTNWAFNSPYLVAERMPPNSLSPLLPAGEHIRLWTRSLLPSVPLHPAAHSAAPALSSRHPPHLLSTTLNTFFHHPPSTPPNLLIWHPSNPYILPFKPHLPDIVLGINGTSHHGKLEALSTALPSSLQFVSLSGNSQTFVSSAS